jgi:hypothetical protein
LEIYFQTDPPYFYGDEITPNGEKKFLENFQNFDYVCGMNEVPTTCEEFVRISVLKARYDRKEINMKYYMTIKEIMYRDSERKRMGGSKSIHELNAVNSLQQG